MMKELHTDKRIADTISEETQKYNNAYAQLLENPTHDNLVQWQEQRAHWFTARKEADDNRSRITQEIKKQISQHKAEMAELMLGTCDTLTQSERTAADTTLTPYIESYKKACGTALLTPSEQNLSEVCRTSAKLLTARKLGYMQQFVQIQTKQPSAPSMTSTDYLNEMTRQRIIFPPTTPTQTILNAYRKPCSSQLRANQSSTLSSPPRSLQSSY